MFAHHRRLLFLVALALMLLSFFIPYSTVTGQQGDTWYNFEFEAYNSCSTPPEMIHFVGRIHMFSPGGSRGNQAEFYRFHVNLTAHGIGEFGNEYVYNSGYQDIYLQRRDYEHLVVSIPIRESVISRGRGTNFAIRGLYHLTFNAQGEIVRFEHGWDVECRGS